MIQLIIGMTLAIMVVGFFLFAEFNLRIGEILMWSGLMLFLIVIIVSVMGVGLYG